MNGSVSSERCLRPRGGCANVRESPVAGCGPRVPRRSRGRLGVREYRRQPGDLRRGLRGGSARSVLPALRLKPPFGLRARLRPALRGHHAGSVTAPALARSSLRPRGRCRAPRRRRSPDRTPERQAMSDPVGCVPSHASSRIWSVGESVVWHVHRGADSSGTVRADSYARA